ncbi:Gfo/Idh/MocA family protein [Paenibacillaceae bacterium WGS1546]|uniref:Gfo/Idh/MocA family protein n=1 Tax=Cohnella sp. WGS1546 TaxID=3366810 RepID=UPI00372D6F82
MSVVKFAIVGTGWVAGEYAKAVLACPEAELRCIVSSDAERAARQAGNWGVDARIYTDYAEMLRDPQVDAVILCSTANVRPEQAVLAARQGKHLVMEKPLAMNRAGVRTMAEALRENPVTTSVGFVLRWNPGFETIKALIDDDALGRVFMAQIDYWNHIGPQLNQYRWSRTREYGGSSMLSAGCHAVDALRLFVGEAVEVTAYSAATWANSDYEFDPNAIAIFKLKNGGIAKVSSSLECKTPYRFNIHLLGEKGSIVNNSIFSHKFPGQTDYAAIPTVMPENGDVAFFPFNLAVAEFVSAVRLGGRTRCDFADAYRSMELCFAIDESIATGNSVAIGDGEYAKTAGNLSETGGI